MTNPEQHTSKPRDPKKVLFVGGVALAPGEVNLHRDLGGDLTRSLEEVKEDWNVVMQQVAEIISGTDAKGLAKSGYQFGEINISLGFNAKGKLAFIAEAGVEASVSITFTKAK